MTQIIRQFNNVRVRAFLNDKQYSFRSKLEYRFALCLEAWKKLGAVEFWEYETRTFWFDGIKRGTVSYMPDFYVVEKDGTEIFEGDVVQFDTGSGKPDRATKEYQEHCYHAGFFPDKSTNAACWWEIIGTIHDTPKTEAN